MTATPSYAPAVRRLVVPLLLVLLLATPGASAQQPPVPSGQGVNVVPSPDSRYRGANGTVAELGQVAPDQPVRDAVLVRSSFDEDREVLLYGADAVPARGGGFGFDARTDSREQVGAWLSVAESVVVPARGEVRVEYTVAVPAGTPGGEYVGGLVAEPVGQAAGSGVQTVTRFAMALYLRVPGGSAGETPGRGSPDGRFVFERLELRRQGDLVCPVTSYRNDSQDILDPTASVRVEGVLGRGGSYEQRGGAVLPGSAATVELPCVGRPLGPRGRVEVTLSTPRGTERLTADAAWLPWPFVVACLSLLLLLVALLLLLLRGARRRRRPDAAERAAD